MVIAVPYKNPAVVLLALVLGVFGLALVFSDLGGGETWLMRAIVTALFFYFCGLIIGFISPKLWLFAVLATWGGILMGGSIVLMALARYGSSAFDAKEPPFISAGLTLLIIPPVLALIGGYTGHLMSRVISKQI